MSRRTRNCTQKMKVPVRHCIEQLEDRAAPTSFRSIDGTGNNQAHTEWGSTGEALLRIGPVRYADGISTPAPQGGVGRPSPWEISNVIVDTAGDNPPDERSLPGSLNTDGDTTIPELTAGLEQPRASKCQGATHNA